MDNEIKTPEVAELDINEVMKVRRGKLYDLYEDSELILSSFLMAYNLNLINEEMHWYVFCSLVSALPEDTPFSRAIYYRSVDLTEIKSKSKRQIIKNRNPKKRSGYFSCFFENSSREKD